MSCWHDNSTSVSAGSKITADESLAHFFSGSQFYFRNAIKKYSLFWPRNRRPCTTALTQPKRLGFLRKQRSVKIIRLLKRPEVGEYVNGTVGFGNMCFVIKMSEPVTYACTWKFKSNDGSTPRYLTWCFASSSKIEEKALVLSENFKTLMHYGFLMKLSA